MADHTRNLLDYGVLTGPARQELEAILYAVRLSDR
jgi:hypothetical protein